jgi:hypothetical protein
VVIDLDGSTEPIKRPIATVADIPPIVAALVAEGTRIVRVTPAQRSLEDVYLDLVGDER